MKDSAIILIERCGHKTIVQRDVRMQIGDAGCSADTIRGKDEVRYWLWSRLVSGARDAEISMWPILWNTY
jgi:hypothetical protein